MSFLPVRLQGETRFARADIEEAAGKLAAVLTEEHADLLLSYDPQGGNGHRDHVRVHQVGARAAELAGVRVAEATVPRELAARIARIAWALLLPRLLTRYRLDEMRGYGMPRSAITHQVDVRRDAAQKRAALKAHRTQVSGKGRGARLFRVLLRCPLPVFAVSAGQNGSPNPGDERANSSPAIRRPGLADRTSAQPQLIPSRPVHPGAHRTAPVSDLGSLV